MRAHHLPILLTALALGACTAGQAEELSTDSTPTSRETTTSSTITTTTTIDLEALEDFYTAILEATTTTTTTSPPTTPPPPLTTAAPVVTSPPAAPSGRCGALPDFICARESGFNPNAVNPTGCGGEGCYGKYQFAASTWNSTVAAMGRPDLVGNFLPDEATQDAVAAFLWAGGAGCGHWAAC